MNAAHERTQKTLPFLCREYNRREGCSRFDCQELHYCSHFLLYEGCTAQGCTKVHDQETPRNVLLLERLGWCGPGDMQLALDSLRRQVRGQAISVCLAYNAGCCTLAKCYRLNVCYRHVLDGCPLDDCELSHDVVGDQHNSAVLAATGLDDTPVSELLQRLTRQLRRRPPQPAICRAVYGRPGGCHKRHCLRLHCCEEFVLGQCSYGDKCFKRHSLQDPHNQRVLRFFDWTESRLLAALATEDGVPASLPTGSEPRAEGGDGDDDRADQSVERHQDQHDEDSGAVVTMHAAHKKTTQKPLPLLCREYKRREGCARFNCQELHVCFHFLLRKCTAQGCTKEHELETPRNILLLERLGWCGPGDMQLALDSLRRQVRDQAISVCMMYNFGCCMQTGCYRLHVCYRHVLDGCPLDDCELSHDVVGDQHNSALLAAAGLDDTPVSELLQRLSEQLRRRPPYPSICRSVYRRPGGCDRYCLRLHCCEEFVRGQCRYEDKCFKGHSLQDPHNQRVLRFFGWTESWVLAALATEDGVPASLPTDSEPRTEGGDGDDDGDRATQSVERHQDQHGEDSGAVVTMNAAHKKTTQKTLPLMCKEYNRREGCARFNCQELHLCLHFLLNKCLAQEHPWTDGRCSRMHDLETPRNIVLLERLGWCGPGDMQLALDSLRRQVRDQAISVCMMYNFGCCMQTGCCRLHVCYRHVLDVCPLDDCELSHDVVGDQHNSAVLSAAGLDDATVSELLQRLSEQLRRRPPYPSICRFFYGRPGGCDRHCLRFHCCEEFARGQCRYGDKCFQSHSLRDPHNQRVLRFFGWTESWVLAALAAEDGMPASLPTDSEPRAEGGDDDGDRATQSVERYQDQHGEESVAGAETCVKKSKDGGSQRNRTERPAEIAIKYPERYHQLLAQRAQQRQQQQQTQGDAVERLERERREREHKENELEEKEQNKTERRAREKEEMGMQERARQDEEDQARAQKGREQQERELEREKSKKEMTDK